MIKLKHRPLIALSGLIWLAVGIFLLSLGVHFVLETLAPGAATSGFSFLSFAGQMAREQAAIALVSASLFVGFLKGRFVLSKSALRSVRRIVSMPEPVPLKKLYSPAYYILLASMIGLGMLMRVLPIAPDTRGAVDIAIGFALINGAMLYFRYATTLYHETAKLKNKT